MVIERGRAYLQRVVDRLVGPSLDQEPPIDALTESEQYRMDALVTYIYDNTEGNIAVLRKRSRFSTTCI